MTTIELARAFVNGATKGKAASLSIEGDRLFSYDTIIAQRTPNLTYLNVTKYSVTTSKHQTRLKRLLPGAQHVEGIPMGRRHIV
jgi:hypothetical protein